ncbi:MAG: site-2 protease family protein [Candidatus Omnitrophota bacterium]
MLSYVVLQFVVLAFAITIHEFAHGWVAYKCGDPTAKYMGRLSLNPIRHIDPFGTIILPIILVTLHLPPIGWAKPVPVNFNSLKNPKRDMLLVGLAGPAANFLMALCLSLFLKIFPILIATLFGQLFVFGIIINVVLGVFNLIPIPPLDGSRIITALLPWKYVPIYNKIQPYGFVLIIFLLWSGVLRNIVSVVVYFVIKFLGIEFSLY